jgi:hypothetical protein
MVFATFVEEYFSEVCKVIIVMRIEYDFQIFCGCNGYV